MIVALVYIAQLLLTKELMNTTELILEHKSLADDLAKVKKSSIQNRSVYYEDLQAAAYIGLVQAAYKYKEERGGFDKFATYRINGSMNSYLRNLVSWKLDWGKNKKNQIKFVSLGTNVDISEHDVVVDCGELLKEIIKPLPTQGKKMLWAYYYDNQSKEEIAKETGLSVFSVATLLSKYRKYLRDKWRDHDFAGVGKKREVCIRG